MMRFPFILTPEKRAATARYIFVTLGMHNVLTIPAMLMMLDLSCLARPLHNLFH